MNKKNKVLVQPRSCGKSTVAQDQILKEMTDKYKPKMKYYISYFYNIRNMKPNMLPVSTAMWDPKWFHEGKGSTHMFIDKNGVINGVKLRALIMPMYRYKELIKLDEACDACHAEGLLFAKMVPECPFMKAYRQHIFKNDFLSFIAFVEAFASYQFPQINTIVFIVHEDKTKTCGERPVLQEWFEANGMKLPEFDPEVD